jgi:hypothetical protein
MCRELLPFRELVGEADAVMTGHLAVPALERDVSLPYSLSADVARTLRGKLGFDGLICTDALDMGAVAERFCEIEAARRALLGGTDILLVPARPEELIQKLKLAAAKSRKLKAAVSRSLVRLNQVWKNLKAFKKPEPGFRVLGCLKHKKIASRMAEECLAWVGKPCCGLRGSRVLYWEPEAASPEQWKGKEFVSTLRWAQPSFKPYQGERGARGEILVIGSFLSPRAYLGRIAYGPLELKLIARALSRVPRALVVSFGSPFVFESLGVRGLCVFSRSEAAQRAAAKALLGWVKVRGRMPVKGVGGG